MQNKVRNDLEKSLNKLAMSNGKTKASKDMALETIMTQKDQDPLEAEPSPPPQQPRYSKKKPKPQAPQSKNVGTNDDLEINTLGQKKLRWSIMDEDRAQDERFDDESVDIMDYYAHKRPEKPFNAQVIGQPATVTQVRLPPSRGEFHIVYNSSSEEEEEEEDEARKAFTPEPLPGTTNNNQ
jgi:hypothetical protein